jgi:hypothetical protein
LSIHTQFLTGVTYEEYIASLGKTSLIYKPSSGAHRTLGASRTFVIQRLFLSSQFS